MSLNVTREAVIPNTKSKFAVLPPMIPQPVKLATAEMPVLIEIGRAHV